MKEQIISQLKLADGYTITNFEIDKQQNSIYIDIDYHLKSIPCPTCKCNSKIHDRLLKTWRHIDFQNCKVYIRYKNPRAVCSDHGVKIAEVTWAAPKHRFTTELEHLVCNLAKEKSYLQIAKELDEHDTRIRRIVKRSQNEENN